jgi:DNA ligase D-like protein (predicted ligase)
MMAYTAEPFDSNQFCFELKWDGLRAIAYIKNRKVEFQNRNLTYVTKSYPELHDLPSNLEAKSAIVDGEVVILENGRPSFESLQNRFGVDDAVRVRMLSKKMPATYVAFDLLHLNGRDIIDQPLSARKARLQKLIKEDPYAIFSEHVPESGRAFFRKAVGLGFEGIIAKRVDSTYQIGVRSNDWLKIKDVKTMDALVCGYTEGTGARSSTFGALVAGAYNRQGKLVHVGNVGTGFTDQDLAKLSRLLKPHRSKTRTLSEEVEAPSQIVWVKPRFVIEVGYVSLTSGVKFRFPRFIKLRVDGNPSECII